MLPCWTEGDVAAVQIKPFCCWLFTTDFTRALQPKSGIPCSPSASSPSSSASHQTSRRWEEEKSRGEEGSYLAGVPAPLLVSGTHHVLGQGTDPAHAKQPVHDFHLHFQQLI